MAEIVEGEVLTSVSSLRKSDCGCFVCGSFLKRRLALIVWILSYAVFFFFSRLMGSIKVRKTSNFSGVGRTAIVISNHAGILDPWIIFSSLPLPVFYRLLPVRPYATLDFKKENRLLRFFKKTGITGAIYYLYNVIAISRNGSFEEKINPLVHALQKKDSVLMFPEGSISTKEVIRPFKKGVVELYRRTGVPILPCVLKYRKRGILFYKIEVVFGEPLHIPKEILEGGGEFHMNSIEFLENKLKKLYEYV